MKRKIGICLFIFWMVLPSQLFAEDLYRDTSRFTYGLQKMLLAPTQILVHTINGTFTGPPIVGTVSGVLGGTVQTVSDLLGGVFDIAASAVPYAKYGLFFV